MFKNMFVILFCCLLTACDGGIATVPAVVGIVSTFAAGSAKTNNGSGGANAIGNTTLAPAPAPAAEQVVFITQKGVGTRTLHSITQVQYEEILALQKTLPDKALIIPFDSPTVTIKVNSTDIKEIKYVKGDGFDLPFAIMDGREAVKVTLENGSAEINLPDSQYITFEIGNKLYNVVTFQPPAISGVPSDSASFCCIATE